MKTKLFTLLFAIVASIGTIFANGTEIDGICYILNSSDMTASVTFHGSRYSSDPYTTSSVVIPSSVSYTGQSYSVASIGNKAFFACNNLTSVVIPNSITSIGTSAFERCYKLASITIPNSVTSIGTSAFSECQVLTAVNIPNGVTSIGGWTFYGCNSLTSITIPESVTSIDGMVFDGCTSLTSIVWDAKNCADFESENNCLFYYYYYDSKNYKVYKKDIRSQITSLVFGDKVEHIPAYLCCGLVNLTSIALPESVKSIGEGAFASCGITSIIIPSHVTNIGAKAFKECGITSITIPSGVTSIGSEAFSRCGITSITIPNNVTSIGNGAFANCSSLNKVYCEMGAPISIGETTFPNTSNVYVPECGYTAFSVAPVWKNMALAPVSVNLAVMNNTGGVVVENCGQMEIEAISYIGYHFKRWQDGNKENPRKYTLSQSNRNFIAEFEIDKYTITLNCDASQGSIIGDKGKYNYDTDHTIEAVPNYGYHFTQWSDGETENPREFTLVQDTTFTALFAPNKYKLTIQHDNTYGDVVGEQGTFDYLSEHSIQVNAKYGYHFVSWSDGVTDNPRTLVLTKDTTITASFAPNKYTFEAIANAIMGTVTGEQGEFDYLTNHTIEAVPNYGYHFTQWSDGETDNPREFTLVQDTTFTALFAPNKYNLTIQYDNTYGDVVGEQGTFDYLSEHSIQVNAKYGYHFDSWSDGVTDNPRTLVLTKDTTITASFAPNKYTFEAIANAIMGTVTGEQGEFDYLTNHTIEAVPNYGYHFTQWSDGETDNPREFTLVQDTTFTALFAPNKYKLTILCDNTYGEVVGEQGTFDYLSEHSIQINAKYGYHFTSWSDGVTDNPRTLVLTKDTTITASFAPNKYKLEVLADATMGAITGEQGEFDYLTEHTVEAVQNTGYLFTGWSDGVTDNPRTIVLTKDTSITALFEHNLYNITVLCNEEQGSVEATGEFYEGGTCTITATPKYGYHFTQWSDGDTNNPRTFTVTKDETFTAEFAIDKSGTCGDNLALTWTYDSDMKELTISGNGALSSNYTFGIEAPTSVEKLTIAEGVTAIGNSAFANYTTIQEIVFATSVKTLYEQAFYNCANLISIYCYRERPCVVYGNTFDGVDKFDCTLYVPTASIDMYKAATGWRDFYFIEAIPGTTTAIENSSTSQQNVHKIIRNGQIFILRDGKTYTVEGQEVR